MRRILLASSLLFFPITGFAEPSCVIPSASPTTASSPAASMSDTLPNAALISTDRIARIPALTRLSSGGASLYDLGMQHGLPTVFAKSGSTFQVFYLTPDGQAAIGGVMWDYTGHKLTRDQVTPIDGTIPTVTIAAGANPAGRAASLPRRNQRNPLVSMPRFRALPLAQRRRRRQRLACICSSIRCAASRYARWISCGRMLRRASCRWP